MNMKSEAHERSRLSPRGVWSFPFSRYLPDSPSLWRSFDDLFHDGGGRNLVAVEEFTEDGNLVVRAEIPGIDPDKDVDITVSDGMLHISAERNEKEEHSGRRFQHRELRYGSFTRSLPLPPGVDDQRVTASYENGMLEVRVPLPVDDNLETVRHVEVRRAS